MRSKNLPTRQSTALARESRGGKGVGVRKLTKSPVPDSFSSGTTRYDYNARGQLTNQWGGGTYPVAYTYDNEGRMTTLSTYRAGSFTATTWADAATGQTPGKGDRRHES